MDRGAARPVAAWAFAGLTALAATSPEPARGEDRWTDPYPGVRHLFRTTPRPWEMHVLLVDLTRPEIRVVATKPGDRRTITSEFARRVGAQIAINANFYGGSSCGLAMGDGERWGDSYEGGCVDSVGVGRDRNQARYFRSSAVGDPPDGWITDVVSGKPRVVADGNVVHDYNCNFHICALHPRTVVGVTEDGRTLILLVVDGRSARSAGMDGGELGATMREFGAHQAVNLDGGGSTTLFIENEGGVVNRPSDGQERTVMNHLGIRVDEGAAWWAAEWVEQTEHLTLLPGQEAELWVRYRNRGRRRWRPDGDNPVRLGTDEPQDRDSPFFLEGDWLDPRRATAVDGEAGPGDVGTFTFRVRAPAEPGEYPESFTPVADGGGGGWMRPSRVFWNLTVPRPADPPDDPAADPPDDPPDPGGGGGEAVAEGEGEGEGEGGSGPPPGTCQANEVCNGRDDDCDGEVDEGGLAGRVGYLEYLGAAWVNDEPVGDGARAWFHLRPGRNEVRVDGQATLLRLPSGEEVAFDGPARTIHEPAACAAGEALGQWRCVLGAVRCVGPDGEVVGGGPGDGGGTGAPGGAGEGAGSGAGRPGKAAGGIGCGQGPAAGRGGAAAWRLALRR